MPMIQEWSKLSLPLVAQNAGLNLPKVSISTIGPLPVKCSAWPAVRLLTGNSFLQLQTKMSITDAEIHTQINFIRCAGGQKPSAQRYFFVRQNLQELTLIGFIHLNEICKLQCNPYYPAIFVIRLFFSCLVTTFSTYPGNSQTDLFFLQPWAIFSFILRREQLIQ